MPEGKISVVTENMARSSSVGAENGFKDVKGRERYGRTTCPEVLSTAGFQVLNASWLVGELFALKGQGLGGSEGWQDMKSFFPDQHMWVT